jgi:translation initiation factor 2 subunit 1
LSKRRVSAEEVQKCEEKYNKSKAVHSIIRHVAEMYDLPAEKVYEWIGWPLYRKYGHAYDAFKLAIQESNRVFEDIVAFNETNEEIPSGLIQDLLASIKRRLIPQKLKLRADIEVSCYGYEGIEAIRAALTAGEKAGREETPIKIKLVAPPLYVLFTSSLDKVAGIEAMNKAITYIDEHIRAMGGQCIVKMKPKAISDSDEMELESMMKRAEMENAEVSGDEDTSETDHQTV